MSSDYGVTKYFLSYEGVHEVCPLCGKKKNHTLASCPQKPPPCLDLVVAQLKASNLDNVNHSGLAYDGD